MIVEEIHRCDLEQEAFDHTANHKYNNERNDWVERHYSRKELRAMTDYELKELYREFCTWHTDKIDIKVL